METRSCRTLSLDSAVVSENTAAPSTTVCRHGFERASVSGEAILLEDTLKGVGIDLEALLLIAMQTEAQSLV